MKNKKEQIKRLQINSKFLVATVTCMTMLIIMIAVGTSTSKKTYSSNDGCTAEKPNRVGNYCCEGEAESNYISNVFFQTDSRANSACLEMKSVTYGTSSCSISKLDEKKPFYNGQYYNNFNDAMIECINNTGDDAMCESTDVSEIDAYTYKITGAFYFARNCIAADTSEETNPLTLTFNDGTLYIGENETVSVTASGGKSPYSIELSYCSNDKGLSFNSSGNTASFSLVQSTASPNNVTCRVSVTDANGTKIDKSAKITIAYKAYCKNDAGTLKWVTKEAYNSAIAIDKSQIDCVGCYEDGGYYLDNDGICKACKECAGGACVCYESSKEYEGKDNANLIAAAKKACGEGKYIIKKTAKNICYTYECTNCDNTGNGRYSTEDLAKNAGNNTSNCSKGLNRVEKVNGCYKYICNGSGGNPPSGSSKVIVNPPTGSALIYIVWIIGFATIGYSIWYFTTTKNNE